MLGRDTNRHEQARSPLPASILSRQPTDLLWLLASGCAQQSTRQPLSAHPVNEHTSRVLPLAFHHGRLESQTETSQGATGSTAAATAVVSEELK